MYGTEISDDSCRVDGLEWWYMGKWDVGLFFKRSLLATHEPTFLCMHAVIHKGHKEIIWPPQLHMRELLLKLSLELNRGYIWQVLSL